MAEIEWRKAGNRLDGNDGRDALCGDVLPGSGAMGTVRAVRPDGAAPDCRVPIHVIAFDEDVKPFRKTVRKWPSSFREQSSTCSRA
jgi:hypothetical protein